MRIRYARILIYLYMDMNKIKILFEDRYLLVCEKPIGVQSQKSSNNSPDMITLLSDHRVSRGESSYVGLVHRLDTPTGGVMIYSKQEEMTGKLSALVQTAEYRKEYLAVVHGTPTETSGELIDLLYHDKIKNKSYVVNKIRRGVKEAIAEYSLLQTVSMQRAGDMSLVKVRLVTGRTHQIRVQFASRKMALVGDGKYGSCDNRTSCALWSYRVSFTHPITKKQIVSESYPDDIYPWNMFDLGEMKNK